MPLVGFEPTISADERSQWDRHTLVIRKSKLKIGRQFQLSLFQVAKFRCRVPVCPFLFFFMFHQQKFSNSTKNHIGVSLCSFYFDSYSLSFYKTQLMCVRINRSSPVFAQTTSQILFVCSMRRMFNELQRIIIIMYNSMQRDTNGETNF
jgi:hypothetical protein